MPKSKDITIFWQEKIGNFSDLSYHDISDGVCFACGYNGKTERAHIVPICKGGKNELINLQNLCKRCHQESEIYESWNSYWIWFNTKNHTSGFQDQIQQIQKTVDVIASRLNKKKEEITVSEIVNFIKKH